MIIAMVSNALSHRFIKPINTKLTTTSRANRQPDMIKATTATAAMVTGHGIHFKPSSNCTIVTVMALSMPSNIPPQLRTNQVVASLMWPDMIRFISMLLSEPSSWTWFTLLGKSMPDSHPTKQTTSTTATTASPASHRYLPGTAASE